MAIWKLATSVAVDGVLPRDAMMVNPVINDTVGGGDIAAICLEWANELTQKLAWSGTGPQIQVKAYDVEKKPHGPPAHTTTLRAGQSLTSVVPREIALCLSFYSEFNAKRRRGRLYFPAAWLTTTAGMTSRPAAAMRTFLGEIAVILQNLGGIDDDWSIWSPTDQEARKVTNWWVDDEWDIQRRRGRRGTTRTTGTTSE